MSRQLSLIQRLGLLTAAGLLSSACTAEPIAPTTASLTPSAAVVGPSGPLVATWCDAPPFTCATAAISLTPAGGRTNIRVSVRNLQGSLPIYGTRLWGIEKIRFQLAYGALGVKPIPSTPLLLEQGSLGTGFAPPVNAPLPWGYTATTKMSNGAGGYRDVVLLTGPAIVGCAGADWGPTAFYQTCPDTASFTLSVPGSFDWKAVEWLWFVGHKHDCAIKARFNKNGMIVAPTPRSAVNCPIKPSPALP